MDVHELDAASNNGVDAMRDLVARAALGTPGRWKVYIVDEVHMLSTAASNALLKTLEEPPGHVVFVLATTDPQKVLPTIRSRTQHYEFRLLGPEVLQALLDEVHDQAGLDLPDHAIDAAVRRGRGSARDALSVLDQVVAAGVVDEDVGYLWELTSAVAERDGGRAIRAVAAAIAAGRDPQGIAGELADHLRQGFLSMVAPDLVTVAGEERRRIAELAEQMGLARGGAGDGGDGPGPGGDPRHPRSAHPRRGGADPAGRTRVDDDVSSLALRVERLERAVHDGVAPSPAPSAPTAVPAASTTAPQPSGEASLPTNDPAADPVGAASSGGPQRARKALGAVKRQLESAPAPSVEPASKPKPEAESASDPPAAGPDPTTSTPKAATPGAPTRDQLSQAWGDGLLAGLPQRARARFRVGRFVSVDDGVAVYGLPNEAHRGFCEEVRGVVEEALPRPLRHADAHPPGRRRRQRRPGRGAAGDAGRGPR